MNVIIIDIFTIPFPVTKLLDSSCVGLGNGRDGGKRPMIYVDFPQFISIIIAITKGSPFLKCVGFQQRTFSWRASS